MTINLTQIYSQVRQIEEESANLTFVRSSLYNYRCNLNKNYKSAEMTYINQAIENHMDKLAVIAKNLSAIGSDIRREAESIKRTDDLAGQNNSGK